MLFNSPVSPQKAATLIALLDLPAQASVLDIGCGKGEWLLQVLEAYPEARGLGLDQQAEHIAAAKDRQNGRVSAERCSFETADIQQRNSPAQAFDLLLCIGASQAFATGQAAYPALLQNTLHLLRPGGIALIGEGFWQQAPARDYLELIGEPCGIYHNHAENIAVAQALGFTTLYATTSNQDEWDHFEWSHQLRVEKALVQSPQDPAALAHSLHRRQWMAGYLRWGRDTMGFGLYLFQAPQPLAGAST